MCGASGAREWCRYCNWVVPVVQGSDAGIAIGFCQWSKGVVPVLQLGCADGIREWCRYCNWIVPVVQVCGMVLQFSEANGWGR